MTTQATVNVSIKDDEVKQLVSHAIFQALSQERRDEILKEAVAFLLTPERDRTRDNYGSKYSPIQEAFNRAVCATASHMVFEKLTNDQAFKAELESIWKQAWLKIVDNTDVRQKLVDKVSNAIAESMVGSRF